MRHTTGTSPGRTVCCCRGWCWLKRRQLSGASLKLPTDGSRHCLERLTPRAKGNACLYDKNKNFLLCNSESLKSCPVHWARQRTLRSERANVEKKKEKATNKTKRTVRILRLPTNYAGDLTQPVISLLLLSNLVIKHL